MFTQTTTPILSRFSKGHAEWKAALVQDFVGKKISELRTPSLVIDKTILDRNCKKLGEVTALDVKVRIHVKTHKVMYIHIKRPIKGTIQTAYRQLKVLRFSSKAQKQML